MQLEMFIVTPLDWSFFFPLICNFNINEIKFYYQKKNKIK